jgi:hypothetical protein
MNTEPSIDELVGSRIYGPHRFEPDLSTSGITYCLHGCGCYWSKDKKGGPIGLDPVASTCPNNPADGKKLPENLDHEIVVKQRLEDLYRSLCSANERNEKFLKMLSKLLEEALKPNASIDKVRKILKITKPPKKK